MHPVAIQRPGAISVTSARQTPVAQIRRRRPPRHHPQHCRQPRPITVAGIRMMGDQAGQLERPPRVTLRRPLDDRPHRIETTHRRHEAFGPLTLRMGEKTLRITVEKPEQTRPDLLNVMLGHPVVLLQQPVIGEHLRQLDALSEIRARQTAIRPTHRLIPQELNRVAIPGDPCGDLRCTRHRRAVGGGQMLSAEADEMIETVDEHPRIANTLNSAGHTKLWTANDNSGNQNVTESSASDGAGRATTSSPATSNTDSSPKVTVAGT